jgi:NADH:ubiquinone oxidoreductase subunit 3 (subunit A)
MLFIVIMLGIALAILYVHGALRTRRARRMSADQYRNAGQPDVR